MIRRPTTQRPVAGVEDNRAVSEHEEILRQLHAAAVSAEPYTGFQAVAQQALDDDHSSDAVYSLLERVRRTDLPEDVTEQIEDVMDLVWGWCAPGMQMRKRAHRPGTSTE